MYEPNELLAQIDAHKWPILAMCALAMVGNYVWFWSAYRVAIRDKLYSIPLICTVFYLVHDASFVYRFDDWWNGFDHWYVKLFWFGLVLTVCFELLFLRQFIRYGRDELLPTVSKAAFAGGVIAVVLASAVVWESLKEVLGDPIYAYSFGLAIIAYPIGGAAMMLRRRSQAGQTQLMWAGYTWLSFWWYVATIAYFGEPFQSWQWIGLGVVCTLAGPAMMYWLSRLPKVEPAPEPSFESAAEPVPAAQSELSGVSA